MHGNSDEQAAAGNLVHPVQLLVARADQEGECRVLRGEEEDYGELGEGEEAGTVRVGKERSILDDADDEGGEISTNDEN
jgi:hypothetical protein